MEVARGGAMYISFIVDFVSWRRGVARTWCLRWIDGLAQGGGAVWCHGGIDGRNNGVYADIDPEDCSAVRWR
jgi:hypothetical protein